MAGTPIILNGGATANDAGQSVTGSATNNTQTDIYSVNGYNNQVTEKGGNLDVTSTPLPPDQGFGFQNAPQTTIDLGNPSAVSDDIDVQGFNEVIQQLKGTALTGGSNLFIHIGGGFQGFDTVDVVNTGGHNNVQLYTETNEKVTLTGAANTVTAGSFSTINLNGDATNLIQTFSSTVAIGSKNDGKVGFTTQALLGGAANVFTAGDESVTIQAQFSPGTNQITLGDGNDTVLLGGTGNTITVGGGENTITAGTGADTIRIIGWHGRNALNPPSKAADPAIATDAVTLAGSGNTVTATYENVTIAGTAVTGGTTVTLGNGTDVVTLGGDVNNVELGDGANTLTFSGNANHVTVNDTHGHGSDTIDLGAGSGDVIALGSAGGTITGTGAGTTTIAQTASSKAAVSVDLGAGAGAIALGDGRNLIVANGIGTSIIVGDGQNTVTALGGSLSLFDTVQVGDGKNAVTVGSEAIVSLGSGKDTVSGGAHVDVNMGAGPSRVTVGDDANIRLQNGNATIAVGNESYVGPGVYVPIAGHANGNIEVTTGFISDVELGDGNDNVTTGAFSVVNVGAGHDTVKLGDNCRFQASGSATSSASVTLANDDIVGAVNGRVHVSGGTNATVFLDATGDSSTISFNDKDDSLYLGLNASAHVFLNPAGGDLVSVQAPEASGAYTGTVDVSHFNSLDVFYLAGLYGEVVPEPLQNFAAVVDNLQKSGGHETLSLRGGGTVIFEGNPALQSANFHFLNQYGPVVPVGL